MQMPKTAKKINTTSTKIVQELTPEQRSILANRIRVQMLSVDTDTPLENMDSFKKLSIMLKLFEEKAVEFDTCLPLPELADRYLEIRLRRDRNKPSVVILRHGAIPNHPVISPGELH